MNSRSTKVLRLILGDQLNAEHSWFDEVRNDVVYVIAELMQEQRYVRHHIQKTAGFFLAMQAFAEELSQHGHRVHYATLDDTAGFDSLPEFLADVMAREGIAQFEYQRPDEFRLRQQLADWVADGSVVARDVSTEHFFLSDEALSEYFRPGKAHRLEHFYRKMRERFDVLMTDGQPIGGQWNFDAENRKRLPKGLEIPTPLMFDNAAEPVLDRLKRHGVETLGSLDGALGWPVNRMQARTLLADFCLRMLPFFGPYQDAMTDRGWSLFHARVSFALNTKMLSPQEVCDAAIAAYNERPNEIGLPAVEGFVRQILGWREFIRGIYWANMPNYATRNELDAQGELPRFYWDGQTKMACMRQAIGQSLEFAYAHHIQRLMVTGNFALLLGVHPDQVDAWYLGMYIDAVEWVEMPNTRGMSQHADGGLVGSKPYISSGRYIERMSDHCRDCAYNVSERVGDAACPFNVLYWDFLDRNSVRFAKNPRMRMMIKNYERLGLEDRAAITAAAESIRARRHEL
ncbi:MAG: cryptochrome/photolyase family protein [Pseudomonadales bacterium]